MINFNSLISRADDEILQTLLGKTAVRLIMLLNESLATPTRLRELLLSLHKPHELLTSATSRVLLLELLRESEAKELAAVLGLPIKETLYDDLKSIRITHGSDKESQLLDFFSLETPPAEEQKQLKSVQECSAIYPLFEHQRRAVNQVTAEIFQEPNRVLLHMPTGSGKTRTAMTAIAEYMCASEPTLVVWLAHSEELCDQAAEEFAKAWNALGNRKTNLFRCWGKYQVDIEAIHDGILVGSLAKIYNTLKRDIGFIGKLGSRCSLVVIDEAHQAIANTYKLVLETLFTTGRRTGLLGMTATPGRTWADIAADEELADFFGRRKVSLEIPGYDNPIDYLVREGYIARTTFHSLLSNSGITLSSSDVKYIQDKLEIPARILTRLSENDQRNLSIVIAIEDLIKRHRRIIVFTASVQHASTLALALRARGLYADSVTGETPFSERNRIITNFKSDSPESKILCNFGVLTTGFDAPQTSAAVIARPTNSLVLYSQMVGRAIRGIRAGGNENAEIVTVIDQELPGFSTIAEAFNNWEDVWKIRE